MFTSLRRRSAAALGIKIRPSTPDDRIRFDIHTYAEETPYTSRVYQTARADERGECLSSLLPDGNHAPVLDVDRHVTATPVGDRDYAVTFTGWWTFRLRLIFNLESLIKLGHVSSATHAEVDRLRAVRGLRRLLPERTVTVTFPYEVVALPSRTRGHFHLLCQTTTDWNSARSLATYLGACGLVDAEHVHASTSSEGDFMYVRQPA